MVVHRIQSLMNCWCESINYALAFGQLPLSVRWYHEHLQYGNCCFFFFFFKSKCANWDEIENANKIKSVLCKLIMVVTFYHCYLILLLKSKPVGPAHDQEKGMGIPEVTIEDHFWKLPTIPCHFQTLTTQLL